MTQNIQLYESTPHGNSMLPIAIHKILSNTLISNRVDLHWHEESELLMILTGEGQLRIDERTYSIKKNDIIFIDSGCLHSITCQPGEVFIYYAIMFKQQLIYSMMNDQIQQKYFDPIISKELFFPNHIASAQPWGIEIGDKITHIFEIYQTKEPGFEIVIKSELLLIWRILYLHSQKGTRFRQKLLNNRMETAKDIMKYIAQNYTDKISVSKMASHFHLSESYLCHFFKSATSMTIIEYTNHLRINKSAELLLYSPMDISEIALTVGFNNISYFNKIFLSYMHLTPTEYRNQK